MASSSSLKTAEDGQCQLCKQSKSKYSCPRCNILYCSMSCYKSESHAFCSETFYRECVEEELKSISSSRTSQKRMAEALRGNLGNLSLEDEEGEVDSDYEFIDDDSDSIDSDDACAYDFVDDSDDCTGWAKVEKRLDCTRRENPAGEGCSGWANIEKRPTLTHEGEPNRDEDPEKCERARTAGPSVHRDMKSDKLFWNLTPQQQKEFKELLASGRILDYVPWKPWWNKEETRPKLPQMFPNIPDINTLIKQPVDQSMPFLIMNAVMAYQLTMMKFKSEAYYNLHAASGIYNLSAALRSTPRTMRSLVDALEIIIHDFSECPSALPNLKRGKRAHEIMIDNLCALNHHKLLLALSDMKDCFDGAWHHRQTLGGPRRQRKELKGISGPILERSVLKGLSKKILFYLAYMKSIDESEWENYLLTPSFRPYAPQYLKPTSPFAKDLKF